MAGRCGDPHAVVPDPGLLELTVPQVASAARLILARTASPRGGGRASGGAARRVS